MIVKTIAHNRSGAARPYARPWRMNKMSNTLLAEFGETRGADLASRAGGSVLIAAFSEAHGTPVTTEVDLLGEVLFVSFLGVTGRRESELGQRARLDRQVGRAARFAESPAAVAAGLSQTIGEDGRGMRFPFFFASFDLVGGTGAYACGGQRPLLVGAGGTVTVLEQTGPPLGFSRCIGYGQGSILLDHSQTLIIYNYDLEIGFSAARVIEQVLSCISLDAFEIRDQAAELWASQCPGSPGRNAAMIVMRTTGNFDRRAYFGSARHPATYQRLESHPGRPMRLGWWSQDLVLPVLPWAPPAGFTR
jgi:hypothetical protein